MSRLHNALYAVTTVSALACAALQPLPQDLPLQAWHDAIWGASAAAVPAAAQRRTPAALNRAAGPARRSSMAQGLNERWRNRLI